MSARLQGAALALTAWWLWSELGPILVVMAVAGFVASLMAYSWWLSNRHDIAVWFADRRDLKSLVERASHGSAPRAAGDGGPPPIAPVPCAQPEGPR